MYIYIYLYIYTHTLEEVKNYSMNLQKIFMSLLLFLFYVLLECNIL